MNKYLYIIISIFLFGCSNPNQEFILKGKIEGLKSDTIFALFQLPEYKLDIITTTNGELKYSFTPDTFTVFSLIMNHDVELPIYAEKGKTVTISGDVNNLKVKGEGENMLLAQIMQALKDTPKEALKGKVDSIIRKNNHSYTNLYLIDKYYVQDSLANGKEIEDLVNTQMGYIKDTPYINDLQKKFKTSKAQQIHTLNNRNREGKVFRWSTIRNKYVLIDFWASWHAQSVAEQDSLQRVIKAFQKEDFVVISISLDYDKEAWLKASDRDTTQWVQLCDFQGWNNTLVEEQGIRTLPSNILLGTNKYIIGRDIRGQELIDKLKSLLQEQKEKKKKKR